ncbi:leukemia inhibitory factor receptor isoform X1 [Bufo gargarizans]|uniref:leukemia inhibitory factor receptor isoform X1 n=1 Tax=Bufo gargarizans TaxID=30331 RepID=UPI001CF3F938|nr:leukemia inhibitory factor receptor isoform X1 [Bufo gargarizans]XP_044129374.1 leukemia inhibitory factor receptor isoform X1 [Bufo gargarizans]
MWRIFSVVNVLAALLHHVCGQDSASSDFFKNLHCVTHDFLNMSCQWDTPHPPDQQITYRVCSRSAIPPMCFDTTGNKLEVPFQVFSTSDIHVEAKDGSENRSVRIQKPTSDIPFVPYPPEIRSLDADYQSDMLLVEWTANSSSILEEARLTCEMNVLRGEDLVVQNETVVVYWDTAVKVFHWNWTSDFPLNCSSHSVRVRCFVHEEYYDGEIRMSDWSATKTISGNISENWVFPQDIVVPVGSDVNFCCRVVSGKPIQSITFKSDKCPLVELGNSSRGIRLTNLQMSEPSGDNIFCDVHDDLEPAGTVVFVGHPPDKPQGLSCEARHLKVINCTWKAGRSTGLYGERGTKYTLYERFSGINTSCSGYKEDLDEFNCSYDIKKEQELHEFLLLAGNPLGTANASLAINVTERIHPLRIENIIFRGSSPTEVYLSWLMPGTYTSINLLCEVEIKPVHGEAETRNVTFSGLKDAQYHCVIDRLHPFHVYDFRVRCASSDRFWKWSDWSSRNSHNTSAAAPSRKLDIWREVVQTPKGREIKVYWKHLTVREANGLVTSYKVTWRPLTGAGLSQERSLLANLNMTSIYLNSSDDQDYEIKVTAINSAGFSPPSRITTVLLSSVVNVENLEGEGNGINVTWSPNPNASCGYLVKWTPSFHRLDSSPMWRRFSSNAASGFISSKHFQAGLRYNVSLYGCKNDDHQLLKEMVVYAEELAPLVAPNFTVQETTSRSILVKWEAISEENQRGFLQGYLFYVMKQQNDSSFARFPDMVRNTETKIKNITDPAVRALKIDDLQSGTSYTLGLQAYTKGGMGPIKSFSVLTNDNAVGLILAILIPIVVAVVLGIVTTAICYQKREWIKKTFYPDIPNPGDSKALQFPKNVSEGSKAIKTLEMNRCTPSSVEVVEPFPKILDTELSSPLEDCDQILEDGSETGEDNHAGIIYTQATTHEDTSNPMLNGSASPSVVYIDVQSMYQPQASSEDEPDVDLVDGAGYKPQMQLPIGAVNMDNQASTEDDLAASSGYRPQGQIDTWTPDSPGSPSSIGSENASFGSPCSVNSRHFLIPPADNKDSIRPTHVGWSISSLFQAKQDE